MKIDVKRKRKGKTDYRSRFNLLKSGRPRVVIRKSNRYISAQYTTSFEAQDKVILSTTSKELLKHGWPKESSGALKSIPAAYLTGYLIGKKIIQKEKKAMPIIDLGLARNVSGSRLYAVLNGLIDAGLTISHDEKILPSKERIEGKHLKKENQNITNKIKANIK